MGGGIARGRGAEGCPGQERGGVARSSGAEGGPGQAQSAGSREPSRRREPTAAGPEALQGASAALAGEQGCGAAAPRRNSEVGAVELGPDERALVEKVRDMLRELILPSLQVSMATIESVACGLAEQKMVQMSERFQASALLLVDHILAEQSLGMLQEAARTIEALLSFTREHAADYKAGVSQALRVVNTMSLAVDGVKEHLQPTASAVLVVGSELIDAQLSAVSSKAEAIKDVFAQDLQIQAARVRAMRGSLVRDVEKTQITVAMFGELIAQICEAQRGSATAARLAALGEDLRRIFMALEKGFKDIEGIGVETSSQNDVETALDIFLVGIHSGSLAAKVRWMLGGGRDHTSQESLGQLLEASGVDLEACSGGAVLDAVQDLYAMGVQGVELMVVSHGVLREFVSEELSEITEVIEGILERLELEHQFLLSFLQVQQEWPEALIHDACAAVGVELQSLANDYLNVGADYIQGLCMTSISSIISGWIVPGLRHAADSLTAGAVAAEAAEDRPTMEHMKSIESTASRATSSLPYSGASRVRKCARQNIRVAAGHDLSSPTTSPTARRSRGSPTSSNRLHLFCDSRQESDSEPPESAGGALRELAAVRAEQDGDCKSDSAIGDLEFLCIPERTPSKASRDMGLEAVLLDGQDLAESVANFSASALAFERFSAQRFPVNPERHCRRRRLGQWRSQEQPAYRGSAALGPGEAAGDVLAQGGEASPGRQRVAGLREEARSAKARYDAFLREHAGLLAEMEALRLGAEAQQRLEAAEPPPPASPGTACLGLAPA